MDEIADVIVVALEGVQMSIHEICVATGYEKHIVCQVLPTMLSDGVIEKVDMRDTFSLTHYQVCQEL